MLGRARYPHARIWFVSFSWAGTSYFDFYVRMGVMKDKSSNRMHSFVVSKPYS
jgi:hypothetical protein